MPQITVHHLNNSRSHRILWLLEELGVDYEIQHWTRDPKTMRAPAGLRDIHPLGKAPVVVVDGESYAESGAVIESLAELFGPHLIPERSTPAFKRFRYYMHYAEGSLMPPLLVKLVTGKLKTAPVPFFVRPIMKAIAGRVDAEFTDPEIDLQMSFLNSELAHRAFIACDDFTAADVQISFPLVAAQGRIAAGDLYPNVGAYIRRLQDRDAWQRAIERGGEIGF